MIEIQPLKDAVGAVAKGEELIKLAQLKIAEYSKLRAEVQPRYDAASVAAHDVLGRYELGHADAEALAEAKANLAAVDAELGDLASKTAAVQSRLDFFTAEHEQTRAAAAVQLTTVATALYERELPALREAWRETFRRHRRMLLVLELFGEARHSAKSQLGHIEDPDSIIGILKSEQLTESYGLRLEGRTDAPLRARDLIDAATAANAADATADNAVAPAPPAPATPTRRAARA